MSNAAFEPVFCAGDRVRINYGPGTVVDFIPARGDIGACVVVHADIGQAWFRRPEDVEPMGPPHAQSPEECWCEKCETYFASEGVLR